MKDKVILVDCDGVILDWQYSFQRWMKRHGYEIVNPNVYDIGEMYGLEYKEKKQLVRMFNESAAIRKIPPLRDAIKYIKKLHEEHGYVFHAITSLSNDEYSQHLRTKNLCELFGKTVFETYVYLDTGADKDEVLEAYRDTGCFWVEDKKQNCDLGVKLGLESILMAHQYNADYNGEGTRVQNWKDVYEHVTGK